MYFFCCLQVDRPITGSEGEGGGGGVGGLGLINGSLCYNWQLGPQDTQAQNSLLKATL